MCEFISWIEKDGEIFFCDSDDIRRGREKGMITAQNTADIAGHGMIRLLCGIEGGENHECTDFNSPDNFPAKIVEAIKNGKLRNVGIATVLLSTSAQKIYNDTRASAWQIYEDTRASAWKIYEDTRCAPAQKIYDDTRASAWKIYDDTCTSAWQIYEDTRQRVFWDLFAKNKNRTKAWRDDAEIKERRKSNV